MIGTNLFKCITRVAKGAKPYKRSNNGNKLNPVISVMVFKLTKYFQISVFAGVGLIGIFGYRKHATYTVFFSICVDGALDRAQIILNM